MAASWIPLSPSLGHADTRVIGFSKEPITPSLTPIEDPLDGKVASGIADRPSPEAPSTKLQRLIQGKQLSDTISSGLGILTKLSFRFY